MWPPIARTYLVGVNFPRKGKDVVFEESTRTRAARFCLFDVLVANPWLAAFSMGITYATGCYF